MTSNNIIPQKPLSRCSIITLAPAHVLCTNKEVIFIGSLSYRLQNSAYIFAYSSTREQSIKRSGTRLDWGETFFFSPHTRLARFTQDSTPRFTNLFTDVEKKTDCFAVYLSYFS